MQIQLIMFKADGQRREYTVRKETTVMGRSTECDFQIPLATVSRRHCQLLVKGDEAVIKDLGSSNGTYVNNKRVQDAKLKAGDQLIVGPVTFTVTIDGQPAQVTGVRSAATPAPPQELEGGTLDVEADRVAHAPPAAPAMPSAPLEIQEEVDEIKEENPVNLLEGIGQQQDASDPLSALEAMAQPKKSAKK